MKAAGGTFRHLHIGVEVIRLDIREEDEANPAAGDQSDRKNEDTDEDGQSRVAILQGVGEGRLVDFVNPPLQGVAECALKPVEAVDLGTVVFPGLHRGEVGREDQFRLDQGKDQGGDDHQADAAPDLPVDPGHHEHGDEGHDGGEDTEGDRDGDLLGPLDRVGHTEPLFLTDGIDVFAHHDGIVDHDTDDDEETEERDHVDGDAHKGRGHQGRAPRGSERGMPRQTQKASFRRRKRVRERKTRRRPVTQLLAAAWSVGP